jgi:two-component system, response regulator PdtaR
MSIALNILIVEDEALMAMGYEAIAMEAGHKVTAIARDTASAFKKAHMLKPDVALVDLHLTDGITGNAIALGLRENHDVRSIIIITGNVSDISREARDISLAVLSKPISEAALKLALDAAASRTNRHS